MRNPYNILRGLLAETPLQVGEVLAIDGGVATIALPGGGLTTARGNATVGQRVFVRGGAIEGEAPDLDTEIIELP